MLVVLSIPGAHSIAGSQAPESGAAQNYLLHCQGCHQADGSGQPGYVPSFRDSVSRFLAIPEGRAYLGRVPGTSQSLLDDRARAAVLNWIVSTFDPRHLPANFTPYTEDELARYRRDPESQAGAERARLLTRIAAAESNGPQKVAPPAAVVAAAPMTDAVGASPPQFAICEACHSTSTDGSSAMGPNLRGVVGRNAGSLPNYSYSPAMRASQIVWTRQELEAFLTNTAARVPGNYMAYPGVADPTERAAIIEFLSRLR